MSEDAAWQMLLCGSTNRAKALQLDPRNGLGGI